MPLTHLNAQTHTHLYTSQRHTVTSEIFHYQSLHNGLWLCLGTPDYTAIEKAVAVLQHQSHVIYRIASIVFCISYRGHDPKCTEDNRKTVTGFTGGKNRYVPQNFHPIHRPLQINCLVLYTHYQKQDSSRWLPGQVACTGATRAGPWPNSSASLK